MKRDMDLIRQILFAAEEREPQLGWSELELEASDVIVSEHVHILDEAGLIEAEDLSDKGGLEFHASD